MESLGYARSLCRYHLVFVPKYRKKAIFGQIRKELGVVLRRLARQKESVIEEGHLMPDQVHMMISIPPTYAVSQLIGFIKGKSSIRVARVNAGRKRKCVGLQFWARGYVTSTVGRDQRVVREHIRHQEAEDRRIDQSSLM